MTYNIQPGLQKPYWCLDIKIASTNHSKSTTCFACLLCHPDSFALHAFTENVFFFTSNSSGSYTRRQDENMVW